MMFRSTRSSYQWPMSWNSLVLFILLSSLPTVLGFPGSAGACPRGKAAVEGIRQHTPSSDSDPQSISKAGFLITTNTTVFREFQPTLIELSSRDNKPFKGFLLRMESRDDDDAFTLAPLSSSSPVHNAIECETKDVVVGVTHSFNDKKTRIVAEFVPTRQGRFILDVTVVESNNKDDGSVYSYEQIKFEVEEEETGEATSIRTVPSSTSILSNGADTSIPQLQDNTTLNTTATLEISTVSTLADFPTATPTLAPAVQTLKVPTITTFPPSLVSSSGCRNQSFARLTFICVASLLVLAF